ncbi:MAG: 16S rRNA (guanine(527)-N(7))-methyltransferase RsmG [Angustibacter sp.]
MQRLVDELANQGVRRGLIGPREAHRLWSRHILNCATAIQFVDPESSIVDIGSGAGLPGLVMAIQAPSSRIILVEPMKRRVQWLEEMTEILQLPNVRVVRSRIEDLARADLVEEFSSLAATARAVAPLARLIPLALPALKAGERLIAIKGRSVDAELNELERKFRSTKMWYISVEKDEGRHGLPVSLVVVQRRQG